MATLRVFRPRIWRESASLILISQIPGHCNPRPAPKSLDKFLSRNARDALLKKQYNYKLLSFTRGETVKFMPNTLTFPGGGISDADLSPEWINYLRNNQINEKNLDLSSHIAERPFMFREMPQFDKIKEKKPKSQIPLDIGFRICAIRETFEESGIFLAKPLETCGKEDTNFNRPTFCTPFVFDSDDELQNWQTKVIQDANNFILLCQQKKVFPEIWGLYEWSDWLTPAGLFHGRYDTIFYTCGIRNTPKINLGDGENKEFKLINPADALFDHFEKKRITEPPQIYELSRFAKFEDAESLMSFSKEREPKGVTTWMGIGTKTRDGKIFTFPGDDDFPANPNYQDHKLLSTPLSSAETTRMVSSLNRVVFEKSEPKFLCCNIKLAHGQVTPLNSCN